MLKFKCNSCGAEFEVNTHGELECPFCGAKQYFSDKDFKGYNDFRDSLLKYLRDSNDAVFEDGDILKYWFYTDTIVFERKDNEGLIEVTYTFKNTVDGVHAYINKDNVIYVFPPEKKHLAQKMLDNADSLDYPSADIKGLKKYLPSLRAIYDLKDGGILLAIGKNENVYPLFVFSDLHPRHVAWIVSRMENLCCLLEFNECDHMHMDEGSLFINPKTHEAYLLGGWWDMKEKSGATKCLIDLRKTARKITGGRMSEGPKEFEKFLDSRPKSVAYDDFTYWDSVIENGFGGHNFAKFDET